MIPLWHTIQPHIFHIMGALGVGFLLGVWVGKRSELNRIVAKFDASAKRVVGRVTSDDLPSDPYAR